MTSLNIRYMLAAQHINRFSNCSKNWETQGEFAIAVDVCVNFAVVVLLGKSEKKKNRDFFPPILLSGQVSSH